MSTLPAENEESGDDAKRKERRAAGVACGAHALHDGYTDLHLHHAAALAARLRSRLRGAWNAARALSPAPWRGSRFRRAISPSGSDRPRCWRSERRLRASGIVVVGLSAGLRLLLVALFIGGLGASIQHPIASTLMARAFAGPRSLQAIATYNFSGDLGKMALPAAAVVAAHRDAMATDAGAARCMWPGRGRRRSTS